MERVCENALVRVILLPVTILTLFRCCVGTQRRAKKATHNTAAQQATGEDKKVKAAIKKFGK